jgi:Sap, sulfolipid-1-addressing protein
VQLLEIFLLAVGSMFWPLLLVVVVIALKTSAPARILGWFYAGGMLTTISVGSAMVFAFQDTSFLSGSSHAAGPWVDIVIGALALLAAAILGRLAKRNAAREASEPSPAEPKKPSKSSERVERLVANGGPLGFVGGVVATILPGPLVIIGMANIAQLGYSDPTTFLVIVAFFVVMFSIVEAPLVGFAVAPAWTRAKVVLFNDWLERNLIQIAIWALVVFGGGEIVRGIVTAL